MDCALCATLVTALHLRGMRMLLLTLLLRWSALLSSYVVIMAMPYLPQPMTSIEEMALPLGVLDMA